MRDNGSLDRLVAHVAGTTGLSLGEAGRLVADVTDFFNETAEQFVRRRHREMQTYGVRNHEIFVRIQNELRQRPVRAPEPSVRQLRRMIYG
jgi:hypothetical protein